MANFLDLNGLKQFWTNVKSNGGKSIVTTGYSTTKGGSTGNISDTDTINVALAKLENAIANITGGMVTSFGGQTGAITVDTTSSSNGSVKFAMSGSKLTGSVVGLGSAAYTESTAYAKASHSHALADLTDLNSGWDTLLAAAPDVVSSSDLSDELDGKADKTDALNDVTLTFANSASGVTSKITVSTISGGGTFHDNITVPTASGANYGVISENKVTSLATTAAESLVAELDGALVFKGTVGTGGDVESLPKTDYKIGWTYLVATAGSYVGQTCEVGDMIICKKDYATSAANTDWSVIQTNINGAVTTTGTLTTDQLVVGAGTKSVKVLAAGSTGQVLKISGGKPTWANEYSYTLPAAGSNLGGVKTGGVATISGGQITAISEAVHATSATTASKVANALSIAGLTAAGSLDTAVTYNGSAAVSFNAVTWDEIDTIFES